MAAESLTVRRWPTVRFSRRVDVLTVVCLAVLVLVVAMALLAPVIAPFAPDAIDPMVANSAPSAAHWLGTDSLGRDVFTRLVYGARTSLVGACLVAVVATTLGTTLALACAWFGGWPDRVISRLLDVVFAFPALVFGVLAVAVLGVGLVAPVVALSIAYVPYVARVIRSVAVRERQLPYVEAYQLLGYSSWTVNRHLLRNVRHLVLAQATVTLGYALVDLAAISFIGLGVQPPTPEWGLMVANGATSVLNGAVWESLAAGLAITVTVVAANVLGDRLTTRAEDI